MPSQPTPKDQYSANSQPSEGEDEKSRKPQSDSGGIEDLLADLTMEDVEGVEAQEVIEALSESDIAVVEAVPAPNDHLEAIQTLTTGEGTIVEAYSREPAPAPAAAPAAPQSRSAMADMTLEAYERLIAFAAGEPDYFGRSYVSRGGDSDGIEEMLARLGTDSEGEAAVVEAADTDDSVRSKQVSEAEEPSKIVSSGEELSKTVSAPASKIVSEADARPSKIVSENERRSLANDAKIIAKMRSFRLSDVSAAPTSLVSYPSSSPSSSVSSQSPANDNLVPVWPRTGELVRAVCACVALLIDDQTAIAFTFNLTLDAIDKAKRNPDGFLDPLKRSFDQNLRRAGITVLYFFAIDINDDGRLHLHGAFRYPDRTISIGMIRRIRAIMKESWGQWIGPGKHKQLFFKTLYSDDWANYCFKHSKAVQKIIGPRTFTITHSLGREAKWAYREIRSTMRGEM